MLSSEHKKRNPFHSIFFVACVSVFFACIFSLSAHAATLSLSPSGGTVSVGKDISVRVVVDSAGQSINAVSGGVTFSNNLLTLVGVSQSGSIVSLWAQSPSYSNTSGTASFQGVILNGYNGSYGTVLTLTFQAKATGTATIGLSSGSSSVLLNDGKGTNVLSGTGSDTITVIKAVSAPASTTPVPTTAQPSPSVPAQTVATTTPPLTFTEYQTVLLSDNYIVAKGTGMPNSTATIALTELLPNGTTTITNTPISLDGNGAFTYVSDNKAVVGEYTLAATATNGQNTPLIHISVKNPASFVLLSWINSVLSVKVPLLFALPFFMFIVWFLWKKNRTLKQHLNDAINKVHELEIK